MSDGDDLYDDVVITFLEELWGDGFLSPGGPDAVVAIVDGFDLTGLTIIDIGCGTGGATAALVANHGAGRVIGIDVERSVCGRATAHVARLGLTDRVEIRLVEPGPLPFADASVDVVFSKDSIIHIADKESLAADVFRVLRPGGRFLASDWLISHDEIPTAAMQAYIDAEALDFGMASPARYRTALERAGFEDIELVNRNAWYRDLATRELELLTGPQQTRFFDAVGVDEVEHQIATWRAMVPVLESGEHCPHLLRARRPI